MAKFAVIDTETNWNDEVMSLGAVLSDDDHFDPLVLKYYIITPAHRIGGMYADTLYDVEPPFCTECQRREALADLKTCLADHGVTRIFAYNAAFDFCHLPELRGYDWYDIMKTAAYRQHNPRIPPHADCCSTGRLRSGFGVEPIYRMLTGDSAYHERHNALHDSIDELVIMKRLGRRAAEHVAL